MLVLALDTSTPTVTAGVVELRRPHELIADPSATAGATRETATELVRSLAEHTVTDAFAHAERLVPLARAALAEAGRTFADLDAVVVGLGPGPFTGLRVGIATAAALGDGLGIPVHGVPSHDAMARTAGATAPDLLVVTDARRREVYLSAYDGRGRRLLGPLVAAPAAVPALLAAGGVRPGAVTGAGAVLLDGLVDAPAVEASGPLGAGLVERAAVGLLTGAVPGPLQPLYLRRPDATVPSARRSVLGR